MTDPVIAQDGHTYERSAILEWLKNNDTSPNTREKIGKTLITNHAMRSELSAAGHPVISLNKTTIDKGTSLRITLVLDVSGSMGISVENKNTNEPSFSRLDLIKHAICTISAMMHDRDQLSIITFSDITEVVMPWTKMDVAGKNCVKDVAKKLYTKGGTDIPAGVDAGVAQGGDHTILLTDGANTLKPPRGTLANFIIEKIAGYHGKIHSVGLGMADDLDTPTLRAVSASKGGLYCFCPDASMVGTVFIHLMANICVNEPGVPFDNHDRFLQIIIRAAATKDIKLIRDSKFDDPILDEDLVSVDDNKGQVEKALINWSSWGRHYLPAFIDAHMRCMTTNFKDASLQGYATPNTRAFIDAGEVTFVGISPPIPSCNNYNGRGYSAVQFTGVAMNSQGVCYSQDTLFRILDPNGPSKMVAIKDIRKGMHISTYDKITEVLCVVISPATEMIKIKDFWVSRKHPLLVRKPGMTPVWAHADTFEHDRDNVQIHKCYNMVLKSGHVVKVGNYGIEAVTLGHLKQGGIVEHPYLGTDRIVNDLSRAPGWEKGTVELKGLKRDNNGYINGIEY